MDYTLSFNLLLRAWAVQSWAWPSAPHVLEIVTVGHVAAVLVRLPVVATDGGVVSIALEASFALCNIETTFHK